VFITTVRPFNLELEIRLRFADGAVMGVRVAPWLDAGRAVAYSRRWTCHAWRVVTLDSIGFIGLAGEGGIGRAILCRVWLRRRRSIGANRLVSSLTKTHIGIRHELGRRRIQRR
jgi:hypothetical protein